MQVLEYDRIEVSQEIDTNKTDTNKKNDLLQSYQIINQRIWLNNRYNIKETNRVPRKDADDDSENDRL